jgi:glycosyltransferase involved in cell wall biosynthesis
MKIGIITERFHPFVGGTETLAGELMNYLSNKGLQITIITKQNLDRKQEDYNCSFLDIDLLSESQIQSFDSIMVFADPFNKSFIKLNPKVVKNSILIMNINETNMDILSNNLSTKAIIVNKIRQYTSVVTFCKNSQINKFFDNNHIKYEFINNFSRDIASGQKRELTKEKLKINKKIMIYHAAVESSKNQIHLVKQFVKSKIRQEFHLLLIGSARNIHAQKYYNELNKLVKETEGISLFKGTSDERIINSLLCLSEVFIIPSKAEGIPITLLEAMSANLFWISTPVGGIPGTLGHLDSGYILDFIDFTNEDLENAIKKYNQTSRKDWESEYTKDKVCEKYYNLLLEVE